MRLLPISLAKSALIVYQNLVLQIAFKTFLLLSVMVSLTLTPSMGQARQASNEPCDGSSDCIESTIVECGDVSDCEGCPPPECCPFEEESDQESNHDDECPSGPHEHRHHHHQSVYGPVLWIIASSTDTLVQSEVDTELDGGTEYLRPPEAPVFPWKRPPIS